jgi:hypothetical protein
MAATIGRLPMWRSYRSARLGSSRNAGPFAFGFWIRPFTRTYSSTKPVRMGKAPVPMMECPVGVFDGEAPTVTWVNQAPCGRSERRYGQSFGHRFSTSMPPESQIRVSSSRGSGRPSAGSRAWLWALPSGAEKSYFSIAPSVGAMSASVIGRWYRPGRT